MQHDATCQPLMYGHVSTLKPYVSIRSGFRLGLTQSAVEVKVKEGQRLAKFSAQPMDRYQGVLWVLLQVTALKTKVCCLPVLVFDHDQSWA